MPGGLLPLWLKQTGFVWLQPGFLAALSITILFFSALYANYLLSSLRMFSRNHLLVAVSITLFLSLFQASNQFSATTLLLPLIILLFHQITRLYNVQKPRPIIINIGIILGIGYLLYHPFLWLLPVGFIGLASMRAFRLHEWLLMLFGILTPVYFLLSYEVLTNQWAPMQHLPNWLFNFKWPAKPPVYFWIGIGAAFLWIVAAISDWQKQTQRMLIQSRKNWYQLLFLGLFMLPMSLFPIGNFNETITLLAFPAGSLAANAFSSKDLSTGKLFLFWLILISCAVLTWTYSTP